MRKFTIILAVAGAFGFPGGAIADIDDNPQGILGGDVDCYFKTTKTYHSNPGELIQELREEVGLNPNQRSTQLTVGEWLYLRCVEEQGAPPQ